MGTEGFAPGPTSLLFHGWFLLRSWSRRPGRGVPATPRHAGDLGVTAALVQGAVSGDLGVTTAWGAGCRDPWGDNGPGVGCGVRGTSGWWWPGVPSMGTPG